MNKSKTNNMAGAGALPLILILGLIIGAGYLLIGGDIELSFLKDKQSVEVRRLDGYPITVPIDESINRKQQILKSEEELINFLTSIDKTNVLTIDEKINFDKEYLIGVTSKTLEKSGNEFKVRKVYIDKEKDQLLVSSKLRKVGDDCLVTEGLNMIVDIVAMSKTDKDVEFETLVETIICSDE